MNKAEARFAYLFGSYFKKTATQQETNELFHLIEHSADNEHLTMLMKKAWDEMQVAGSVLEGDKSYEILNNILCVDAQQIEIDDVPVRTINWRRYATVAAVVLFVSTCVYFGLNFKKQTPESLAKEQHKPLHDAMPGTNKAILTLADGSQVPLDSAHVGDLSKQGRSLVKNVNGKLIYTLANNQEDATPKINMLATPRGGQYQIVLPDGSKVWLNATSSIKYPTFFKGKNRRVEITGEVYFEVAKNPDMPFIVKKDLIEIEVLGTHFNVMAYDDEDAMKTTLQEGAVRIRNGKWSGILKPGQQALLRKEDGVNLIKDVDLDHELAWKNGLFQFADDDIQTIMRKLSRWYDLDVVYQGKIPVKQYIGSIPRNVRVSDVLNMLKYTGVNTEIKGKNIYLLD